MFSAISNSATKWSTRQLHYIYKNMTHDPSFRRRKAFASWELGLLERKKECSHHFPHVLRGKPVSLPAAPLVGLGLYFSPALKEFIMFSVYFMYGFY